jgi:soluble lytic murein transglycosylase-like protein
MDLNKLAAMANKLSIPQLQQAIQSGTLPAYIGVPMLQKRVQDSKQAQMAQQAQQAQQAQAPIADQVMQEAQGIAGVESNLPQEYADGGIVAFAGGGRMPKTMAEQLEELLAKQKMEEYYKQLGWTPEAIESYEPSAYQTPEEARASMSRRGLAATQQPMSLDELTQAQARLRAQTGLGVRAENVMEMPPYQERVEMPKTQLPQTTSVAGEYVPYTPMEQSGIAALNKPSATLEGASFEMPRTTPRADTEAAKAYYAEEAAKKGYRPMSKEAVDMLREEAAQNAKWAEAAKAQPVGPMKPGALSANVADSQMAQEFAHGLVSRPASEYKHPELREKLAKSFPEPNPELRAWTKEAITNTINAQANKYGIDPNWLYGLVGTESGFNPTAVNKQKGSTASGITQITKDTAKTIGLAPEDRFDPEKALAATARTLDKYLAKAGGDLDLATSMWHLGPNASKEDLRKDVAYQQSVKLHASRAPFKAGMEPETPAPAAAQLVPPETAQTPFAIPAFDESPYKAAMISEDETDPRKRMEQYQALLGEDDGRSAREARMSKKEQEIAKDRDQAKWMALLQASLATMAGTSPFAMANIGAGGIAGLKSYAEDTKDINRAQDKLDELRSSYEDARRAEQRAAAKHGVDSAQVAKAHNKAMALQMAKDKAEQEYKWASLGVTQEHYKDIAANRSLGAGGGKGGAFSTTMYRDKLEQVRRNPEAFPQYILPSGEIDIDKLGRDVQFIADKKRSEWQALGFGEYGLGGVQNTGTSIKEPEQTGANTYRYGYN